MVLGFFRVNARYTVRGRRSQVLSPTIRVSLMTPQEREEMARVLIRDYGGPGEDGVAQTMRIKLN